MGLGTITNAGQSMRAANTPQSAAWGPDAARGADTIPDNDSALAVIQNLYCAKNPASEQGLNNAVYGATFRERIRQFTASLNETITRYREMSEKIANGRFSPKILRERVEELRESINAPGLHLSDESPGRNAAPPFPGSEEFISASRGITDTRALAWLKNGDRRALLSQGNIEPERVLPLLR